MQQSFGAYLRQLRRQENLTQIELGGEEFSKSYISAVELEKVVPSRDALRHFAQKLDCPIEDLEQVLQQSTPQPLFALQDSSLAAFEEEYDQEVLALLDVMVKGNYSAPISLPRHLQHLSTLSPESLVSQERRAHYAFLSGLIAQEMGNLEEARFLFEYALALITVQYRSAILDALGTNYYRTQQYHVALSYHQRALELLQQEKQQAFDLCLQVEVHCGNDYRMLQMHQEACECFERARHRLRVNHNMKLAGELYLGLGYSTFAAAWQTSPQLLPQRQEIAPDEIERKYQLSIGYLLQSRTLYQVSSDFNGEMYARLLQTMVLLNLHIWRQQQASTSEGAVREKSLLINSGVLLDEADEQSKQILLCIQEQYGRSTKIPDTIKNILYTAIAYMMRIHIHRAMQTRLSNYGNTAVREQMAALYISRKAFSLLEKSEITWSTLQKIIKLSPKDLSRSESLPSLIDVAFLIDAEIHSPIVLAEICFALGEIAEEVLRGDTNGIQDYPNYEFADRCFHYAIQMAQLEVPGERRDGSYYMRMYQRYLTIIEERWQVAGTLDEEHMQFIALLKGTFATKRQATF
jgi:transcriptional regulator with XRE-family HTH domain